MRLLSAVAFFLAFSALLLPSGLFISLCFEEGEPHECRMWGAIAEALPADIVQDHLLNMPNSLKNLGAYNLNGWGLTYYNASSAEPFVRRGRPPANQDPAFDVAANEVVQGQAHVAAGHVRTATSGLTDIPDPHPFKRFKNGRWWLFAHNGGISKNVLVELIGNEYLKANPPYVGNDSGQWIDSELYFIYILKCLEKQNWNVTIGIAEATTTIHSRASYATMNFLLSDGERLWGFCKGYSLYYHHETSNGTQRTAIASHYPTATQENWTMLSNFELIEAQKNAPPRTTDVRLVPVPKTNINVFLTFQPNTLNLRATGRSMTAYVKLPEGYDVADADVATVTLNQTIPAERAPVEIGDFDNDSRLELCVSFNRSKVVDCVLSGSMLYSYTGLALDGELYDGTLFGGGGAMKISSLIGDVDCDGRVGIADLTMACTCYGSTEGETKWNPNINFASAYDTIDILDLVTIATYYGARN